MRRGRVGRPGLIGTAARTAVIAGTATAASGAVQRRQDQRAQQSYEEQQLEAAEQQRRLEEAARAAAQQPQPQPASQAQELLSILTQLGELHAQGVLTDAEFAAAKAKALG